jgi:hypothetical protein
VAAFAASNLGDVSPNVRGPHCQDTGLPCDQLTSTCGGFVQLCIATGPGKDMEESTWIIGERQFTAAYVRLLKKKKGIHWWMFSHYPPITYYWTVRAPNLGPLISRWKINKFENCWFKSVRISEVYTKAFVSAVYEFVKLPMRYEWSSIRRLVQ